MWRFRGASSVCSRNLVRRSLRQHHRSHAASMASHPSPPIVTVLLPVYNGERYLCEAVESILTQTLESFEGKTLT